MKGVNLGPHHKTGGPLTPRGIDPDAGITSAAKVRADEAKRNDLLPLQVAGIVMDEKDICFKAAPILKWAIGRDRKWLSDYFQRKGWKARVIK